MFGCLRHNINHISSDQNLNVILLKCSIFYARIYYQFKTSELKNVELLVKETVQALNIKALLEKDWEYIYFCAMCTEIKKKVVLENLMWSLKSP